MRLDRGGGRGRKRRARVCTHHDKTERGDDGHEDAGAFSKSERVELHERLRGVESEERVQVWNAEQEKDGRDEPEHACSDRARDDSSTGNDTIGTKLLV